MRKLPRVGSVEVYDNFSWKMATISEVLGSKYFVVRMVGSSRECKVGKSEVRGRQFWHEKWVVIRKDSSQFDSGKQGATLSRKTMKISFKRSQTTPSQNLKRGSAHLYSQNEAYVGATLKFRAVEKEGRFQRVISSDLSRLAGQVALPSQRMGGKEICASRNNRTTVPSEVDSEKRIPGGNAGCMFSVNLKSDDADTITCSVGSCSNDPYKSPPHFPYGSTGGYEDGNSVLHTKKELAAEIHRLELQKPIVAR